VTTFFEVRVADEILTLQDGDTGSHSSVCFANDDYTFVMVGWNENKSKCFLTVKDFYEGESELIVAGGAKPENPPEQIPERSIDTLNEIRKTRLEELERGDVEGYPELVSSDTDSDPEDFDYDDFDHDDFGPDDYEQNQGLEPQNDDDDHADHHDDDQVPELEPLGDDVIPPNYYDMDDLD